MTSRILLRRGTADQWSSVNPILSTGELGIETDTLKIKIGNGTSTWNQLTSYANVTPSQLTSEINNLINAAPATLDTLNELAAAINNDASFSTTVNNLLTGKVSKSGGDTITASTASTVGLIIKGAASQTANLQEWYNTSNVLISWVRRDGLLAGQIQSPTIFQALVQPNSASGIPLTVKGFASQTANLQEWQDSAGGVLSYITASGALRVNSSFGGTQAAITAGSAATVGVIVRGAASQTANLQEWQNSAGSNIASINTSGGIVATQARINTSSFLGYVSIVSTAPANIGAVIRGAASQTANLQEWQNSSGTALSYIDKDGKATLTGGYISELYTGGGITGGTLGYLNASTFSASVSPIVVRGAASQTANLQEWQNNSGTVLSKVTASGSYLTSARISAGSTSVATGNINSYISSPSLVGILVQGAASQTANLQEWQDSSGTVLSSITYFGGARLYDLGIKGSPAGIGWAYFGNDNTSTKNIVVRAFASQTANLQEWQDSAGTVLVSVLSNGRTTIRSNGSDYGAALSVGTNSTTAVGLAVRGVTSQTANLQEWQNSSGTVLARIDANGQGALKSTTLTASSSGGSALTLVAASGQTAPLLIAPGGTQISSSGNYLITPGLTVNYVSNFHAGASNITPIYIRGAASQTADLQQWQDSAGTILTKITSDGKVIAYGDDLGNFQSIGLSSTLYNGFTTTTNNNSGSYTLGTAGASETTFNVPNAFYIYDRINGAMRFKIMSTGLVGINSFNPAAQLQVNSSSASTVGAIIKGSASQTANLQEWQDSTGAVKMSVNQFGSIVASAGGTYISTFGDALFGARNATTIPLTVKGAASQTANLQEWQSSNGTVQSRMTDIGKLFSNYLQSSYGILTGNATYAGGYNFISNPSFATTDVSLIVKAVTSQTADLQQWQDSAGTVLAKVAANGLLSVGNTTGTIQVSSSGTSGTYPSTGAGLELVAGSASATDLIQSYDRGGSVFRTIQYRALSHNFYVGSSGTVALQVNSSGIGVNITPGGTSLAVVAASSSTVAAIFRGVASQTANLQEWQNSAGTVLAYIDKDGQILTPRVNLPANGLIVEGGTGPYIQMGTSATYLYTRSASNKGLIVQGAASQTANLQEWQTSAGTVQASFDNNGRYNLNATYGSGFYGRLNVAGTSSDGYSFDLQTINGNTPGVAQRISLGNPSDIGLIIAGYASGVATGDLLRINGTHGLGGGTYFRVNANGAVQAYNATSPGLIVKGAASQTADLQQWQNSSGAVLAEITSSGSLELNGKDIEIMNIMGAF